MFGELRTLAGCRPLCGLFHVARGCTRVAISGRWHSRLVAARATARRRPLGATPPDPGGRGILELLAHTIELSGVLRTEPATLERRFLTVTSTTTTHRR